MRSEQSIIWINVPLCMDHFSLISRFSFIFVFKHLDYNEPGWDFLYIYLIGVAELHQTVNFCLSSKLENLDNFFIFPPHFLPPFLWVLQWPIIRSWNSVHYMMIFSPYPSLFFRLDDFYWFKFIDSSFISNLQLSPISGF